MKDWLRARVISRWPVRRWHVAATLALLYITGPNVDGRFDPGRIVHCPEGSARYDRATNYCLGPEGLDGAAFVQGEARSAPGAPTTLRNLPYVSRGRDVYLYFGLRTPRVRILSFDLANSEVAGFEALR